MGVRTVEISVKGRLIKVPAIDFDGRTIIVYNSWPTTAKILDEEWIEGEVVKDPEACIAAIRELKLKADIFTFGQNILNTKPNYSYHMEWDNVAAIPLTDYSAWWNKRLSQVARKNVRRSEKRGVLVKKVEFDELLLQGIQDINNETPVRQGRAFWHYGKSIDIVRRDYATLLDRSEFIGAYYANKLIGFIKIIYMGHVASILQILCKNEHYDKRPANALIAKAVEICIQKRINYLTYGKYIYGKKLNSPLTEFKRRNGFEQILIPRYFIPLSTQGKLIMRFKLHNGIKQLLPNKILLFASKLRSIYFQKILLKHSASNQLES
jgi:hypothetical protein